MKRIILSAAAILAFGFTNAQDGGFKLGAHVGLPMGDIKDLFSANLGVDAAYTWKIVDKFDAGLTAGYSSYLGKNDFDSADFVPIAATAQYAITEDWFLGTDLGYAIYVGAGTTEGGFTYQPKFGYQTKEIELFATYKGISLTGITYSSVNLGFSYKL